MAFNYRWNYISLDNSWMLVLKFGTSFSKRFTYVKTVERNQIFLVIVENFRLVSSICFCSFIDNCLGFLIYLQMLWDFNTSFFELLMYFLFERNSERRPFIVRCWCFFAVCKGLSVFTENNSLRKFPHLFRSNIQSLGIVLQHNVRR